MAQVFYSPNTEPDAIPLESILEKNRAALMLELSFPRSLRRILLSSFSFGIFLSLLALFILFILGTTAEHIQFLAAASENMAQIIGIAAILSALWLIVFALEFFVLSARFGGLKASLSRTELYFRKDGMSFDLLLLLFKHQNEKNLATIALGSEEARILFARLGIGGDEVMRWIEERGVRIDKKIPPRGGGKMLLIADIITLVYRQSPEFSEYLFSRGITEDIFFGALDWIERVRRERDKTLRFWSRINLSEIPGLAKDWAYGQAYTLMRYASEVMPKKMAGLTAQHAEDALETVLSKRREANVLLVGERDSLEDSIISLLASKIALGTASPVLEGKRVFILDTALFAAANQSKESYEQELIHLLSESARAGNIILVIKHLADFLINAESVGADVREIVDPFLESDALHVIATATRNERDVVLATRFPFVKARFEDVLVPAVEGDELVFILSGRAIEIEARERRGAFFTFQSIARAAELARTALFRPTLPDDAVDILEAVYARACLEGRTLITAELVEAFVSESTGAPVGKPGIEERDTLLSLEEKLKAMVVGQDDALHAVANALRRARSGMQSDKRPIGSFLFLGPTGVGKTQVARALEKILFKDRANASHRIDMSEFSGADALARLIGIAGGERLGILEEKVARSSYGVLLLDEFEKAHPDVHDLFLQIFDEGFFSNANGERIIMRNLIIIATSNAGAKDIEREAHNYRGLGWFKEELIKKLIAENIFRPELLNRFDDIVLFEPLSQESLRDIAALELADLGRRLEKKRIHFEITDDVLDFVAERGYDPAFGARPMKRIIQESVERILSEKLLRNEILPGATVTFTKDELERALSH
jgi:ATP-dependent Clp protease ATP-binding subunit ClpA